MSQLIQTPRLILRPWREADREPLAALNADPRVMEHFPSTLSREESDDLMDKCQALIERQGWGFWAAEDKESQTLIGFIGLAPVSFLAPFTPAVEIGWRLAHAHWGKGLAPEGAAAAALFAFNTLGLDEIVAFTAVENQRSRRVMEKLGMVHDPESDFEHPNLPEGHHLRTHVLYRLQT